MHPRSEKSTNFYVEKNHGILKESGYDLSESEGDGEEMLQGTKTSNLMCEKLHATWLEL